MIYCHRRGLISNLVHPITVVTPFMFIFKMAKKLLDRDERVRELKKQVAKKKEDNRLAIEEQKLTEELEDGTVKGTIRKIGKELWKALNK